MPAHKGKKTDKELTSKTNKTDKHKKQLLAALEKTLGNVTAACKQTSLSRAQHYEWLDKDEAYREAVQAIDNLTLDFVENKLINLINNEDTAATIFYLKCRGKKRGYVERQEVDLMTNKPIEVTFMPASMAEKHKKDE